MSRPPAFQIELRNRNDPTGSMNSRSMPSEHSSPDSPYQNFQYPRSHAYSPPVAVSTPLYQNRAPPSQLTPGSNPSSPIGQPPGHQPNGASEVSDQRIRSPTGLSGQRAYNPSPSNNQTNNRMFIRSHTPEITWPSSDKIPGRMTPTAKLERSPSMSRRNSPAVVGRINQTRVYSANGAQQPRPVARSTEQVYRNIPSREAASHVYTDVERKREPSGNRTGDPSSGRAPTWQRESPAGQQMYPRTTSLPHRSNQNKQQVSATSPPNFRQQQPSPNQVFHQVPLNRARASPVGQSRASPIIQSERGKASPIPRPDSQQSTESQKRRTRKSTSPKHGRGQARKPQTVFYDSSTDDQRGHSRTKVTRSPPPVDPYISHNQEHLTIRSVEKLPTHGISNNAKDQNRLSQTSANYSTVDEDSNSSYQDVPTTDAGGRATPTIPGLSPVESPRDNESTPFLAKPPKSSERKSSLLRNLTDKESIRGLLGRGRDWQGSQNRPPPINMKTTTGAPPSGQSAANAEERLRRLEAMCGELSQLLDPPTSPNSKTSGKSSFSRTGSFTSRTRWSKRRAKDNTAINKRFQKLETHVITLAKGVAKLSSEMKATQSAIYHLENLQRQMSEFDCGTSKDVKSVHPMLVKRVKKLTRFFGKEPPLLEMLLKDLGYERYGPGLRAAGVGVLEYPLMSEDSLVRIGLPLGPQAAINSHFVRKFCTQPPATLSTSPMTQFI